jgi:hypothetical protein
MELDLPNDSEREFVVSIDTGCSQARRKPAGTSTSLWHDAIGRAGRGSRPGRYVTTADTSKRELQSRTLQALQSEVYAGRKINVGKYGRCRTLRSAHFEYPFHNAREH